ncbi:MAG TPA: hypothetical protein VHO46_03960 [Bacteroidales bacterium]|nr:hypothetical protein [Bacteroidales bacterium]
MKKTLFLLLISIALLASCKKEINSLPPGYQYITGIWNLESISYDSSGVRVSVQSKDRLRIEDDLSYFLYIHKIDYVENGNIDIIDQSDTSLNISFSPLSPVQYSFAGSRVFEFAGFSVVSLSRHELILRSLQNGSYSFPEREYYFTK